MKKILCSFLVFTIFLTGCIPKDNSDFSNSNEVAVEYKQLNNIDLLNYVENEIYTNIIDDLNSTDYFVETIQTTYISKEYIDAISYNSKENVYFGYTLSELNSHFEGERFIFTLGEDNKTFVKKMEIVDDDVYAEMFKDVAIGSGVILICATVSIITAPTAPAISIIFATSATTGTTVALQSGAMSGIIAAAVRGYQTNDFDQAIQAGLEAVGESFKWAAISGAVSGGFKETLALTKATKTGLSMNTAAIIQKESKWPLEVIENLHSYDEYLVYKKSGLKPLQLSDKSKALVQEINWKLVDDKGRTNIQRVKEWGLSPIDSNGKPYELHHIGQKADSPLALLTYDQHHSKENYSIIHYMEEGKDITASEWAKQKHQILLDILEIQTKGN